MKKKDLMAMQSFLSQHKTGEKEHDNTLEAIAMQIEAAYAFNRAVTALKSRRWKDLTFGKSFTGIRKAAIAVFDRPLMRQHQSVTVLHRTTHISVAEKVK